MEKPTSTRYPPVRRGRAVRMMTDLRAQDPHDEAVIPRVARQLGVGDESLRSRVKIAQQVLDFDLNSLSGTDQYCLHRVSHGGPDASGYRKASVSAGSWNCS